MKCKSNLKLFQWHFKIISFLLETFKILNSLTINNGGSKIINLKRVVWNILNHIVSKYYFVQYYLRFVHYSNTVRASLRIELIPAVVISCPFSSSRIMSFKL